MNKQIHGILTAIITVLAFAIAVGNALAVNMRWVTAIYWLLISIRVGMELMKKNVELQG